MLTVFFLLQQFLYYWERTQDINKYLIILVKTAEWES